MTFELNIEEGTYLVKLARSVIENFFNEEDQLDNIDIPLKIREKCGVFVTLNKIDGNKKQLRGCIGYPYPVKPLVEAVSDVATAAAFEDYRFPRLSKKEVDEIVVEVSVLTPPELIKVNKPEEYPSVIKVGVDGLIIQYGSRSGLLLPQVPIEWGWGPEEFLQQCCIKAGLSLNSWLNANVKIFKFQAIIFKEEAPRGMIIREELNN